jgi:hypothetical protein
MERLDARSGVRPFGEEPLEDAPRDPHDTTVLPDLDPELDG